MGATTTTLSTMIKPIVQEPVSVINFRNNHLISALTSMGVPTVQQPGDTSVRFKIQRGGGNSSASSTPHTEGAAIPASGSQTYVEGAIAFETFLARAQVTGPAAAAMRSYYGTSEFGVGGAELEFAIKDLIDAINVRMLGATLQGIQLAIESGATTYAGLARATYTDWVSYEEAGGGGALTGVMVDNVIQNLMDAERGVPGSAFAGVISAPGQMMNYAELIGAANGTGTNRLVRFMVDSAGGMGPLDVGFKLGGDTEVPGVSVFGAPWHVVPDLTATEVLFLTNAATQWAIVEQEGVTVSELGKTDDSAFDTLVTARLALACFNCRHQGKITNLA